MRILVAAAIHDSPCSGMGKWTREVCSELRALGHDVTEWYADDLGKMCINSRAAVLTAPIAVAARLCREGARWDAVLLHEPIAWLYARLRPASSRTPAVVTVCHNVESHVFVQLKIAATRQLARVTRASRLKAPLFRLWQTDAGIRNADHVVCLSTTDREYICHRLGRALDDVSVVPNGVHAREYASTRPRTFRNRVLFVGGWLDIKGARSLVRIWPAIQAISPAARLTLAGAGAPPDHIYRCFPEAVRSSITVTAAANAEGMRRLYAEHDVLLLPSVSEGSPLTVLEAAAAGLPIVATRVGGIPDLLSHEREALLWDPLQPERAAQMVVGLLNDAAMRASLSEAARQRASVWTWARTAHGLVSACERAIAARQASLCREPSHAIES